MAEPANPKPSEERASAQRKSDETDNLDDLQMETEDDPNHWTEAEETALRRKLDRYILPLVTLLYLLCFLARTTIGNARIQGMREELQLQNYRFNLALSVFYIVYFLVEVPSNIMLKKVGPRVYIPFLVACFGFVSMCTAFVRHWSVLCIARAFLGLFQGGLMPGIAFFLSCFYKRQELYFRIGVFVSAASMAGAFGGLLATGLARIPRWGLEATPIHTWRNILFFEGLITLIVGLLAPVAMPTRPANTWFLKPRERAIAWKRLRRELQVDPLEDVRMRHIKRSIANINNWICALGLFLVNITVQGISHFIPTILQDLGWTSTEAQLYSAPIYVVACLSAIAVAWASDKTRMRGIYLALFSLFAITGFSLLRYQSNEKLKYMAVYFIAIGTFPSGPGFLSWGMNNAAGPVIRAISSGFICAIGSMGGIVATWTYIQKDAPGYHTGHEINLGGQIAVLCLALFGLFYCKWENKQRDQEKRHDRLSGLNTAGAQELGYRHPDFRYIA